MCQTFDQRQKTLRRSALAGSRRGSNPAGMLLLVILALVAELFFCGVAIAEPQQEELSAPELWQRAQAAEEEEPRRAARDYERLYRQFGQSEHAEEALWRAAELHWQLAAAERDPDWRRVRNLYRRYTAEYPDSHRQDQAYLKLGLAHFRMRFLREALTYFRLFVQRYPDSPLLPRARYWQARALVETNDQEAAIAIFEDLLEEPDEQLVFDALVGMARAQATNGEHRRAVDSFQELLRRFPLARFSHPAALLDLGRSYFAMGREEEGRDQVFAFLNLAPDSPRRWEALFAAAESWLRQEGTEAAANLYRHILEKAPAAEREAVLARFRLAELEDRQARRQPESATRRDPADPAGDREYRAVIDGYSHQPIAQEARYSLYLRQRFREDTAAAVSTARGYVRHAPDPEAPTAKPQRTGELLYFLLSELLKEGEYQRIYHIYVNEHRHIDAYRPGRLKFIVGRALQELALYRQAAVVYYRALAGTMNEEELPKIYRRRAEVYFALKDYESAQRLLSHLRQLYAENEDFLAEVLYLSGRLRELQRRYDEAREYLRRCLEYPAELPRRQVHVQSLLRVLAAIGNYQEMAELLGRSQKQQWLPPAIAQGWYRRTGDGLRRAGDEEPARQMYTLALAEELPTDNEDYQAAALRLGELLATGDEEQRRQAADYLQSAADGADELLARRARASRNSLRIKELQSEMESLFATEDD